MQIFLSKTDEISNVQEGLYLQEGLVGIEGRIKKRSGKKKIARKLFKELGKEYFSVKNKLIPAREIKQVCTEKCKK